MNGTLSRCISFAPGIKDPLQRVNYEFGLVLGVDEFVDEQCYFLEKEYQHNRSLHGYGTVAGLLVRLSREDEVADPDEIEVRVESGIGIDQYGRVFVVRNTQCASLLSWLEDRDLEPGDQTIYVVARYDECEAGLVPIAGQPCSSGDQNVAPSRLQDIYHIELVEEPPAHPARDAVVNLSEFLSRFRADPAAADLGDLGEPARLVDIIGPDHISRPPADFRGHIDDVVADITGAAGAQIIPIRPPAVERMLDDVFTYWITEVRPAVAPDLIDPDAPENADAPPPPAEILLAQIDFVLPDGDPPSRETIVVDNSVRPYLLHTQLIQELFDIPDMPGEGGAPAPPQQVRDFVTVEDVSARILSLWFHIGENLSLDANVNTHLMRIRPDGTLDRLNIRLEEDEPRRNDFGRFYRLRTFVNLDNGDFLLLMFDTDEIRVGTGAPPTLTEFIANANFTFPNFRPQARRLFGHHVVERGEEVDPEQIRQLILELLPPQEPVIPFVTITAITPDQGVLEGYEFWFHLDGIAEQNDGSVEVLNEENMAVFVESAPGVVDRVGFETFPIRPNVWMVFPVLGGLNARQLIRFAFSLDADMPMRAFSPPDNDIRDFGNLRDYIDTTGQRLEGHLMRTEIGEALVRYAREQAFARRLPQ